MATGSVSSRRSMLRAGVAGLAGLALGVLGKPKAVEAAAGGSLVMGASNSAGTSNTTLSTTSTGTALQINQYGSGTALRGQADQGIAGFFTSFNGAGVSGVSANKDKIGVYAANDATAIGSGCALRANGKLNHGLVATTDEEASCAVKAVSNATAGIAVLGLANGTGLGDIPGDPEFGAGTFVGRSGVIGVAAGASATDGVVGATSTPGKTGVAGYSLATSGDGKGVYGDCPSPSGTGVLGEASAGIGVKGRAYGGGTGVYGVANPGGYGVRGLAADTTVAGYGVSGEAAAPSGTGVYALNSAATAGSGSAVYAQAGANDAVVARTGALDRVAVRATNTNTTDGSRALVAISGYGNTVVVPGGVAAGTFVGPEGVMAYGTREDGFGVAVDAFSPDDDGVGVLGVGRTGVRGQANATNGIGVYGYGLADSIGVYGRNLAGTAVSAYTQTGWALYGQATDPAGRALECDGDAHFQHSAYVDVDMWVTGSVHKGGGSFKIDHPLDPAGKYLYHSFVESPDMMNVYNGNATLDAKGEATVTLPDWFEALNRDFRYQLTAIGPGAPDLHVAAKVKDGRFSIGGGKPGQEISWQLTGIRKDDWANAHRIPVEQAKPQGEAGLYLHPIEHGKPADKGLSASRPRPKTIRPAERD